MQRMGIAAIMINFIRLVVGFDQREAIAYHVFVQSVIQKSSSPISFYPLSKNALSFYNEIHTDRSNAFTYSRFLTPYLMNFEGWAIYLDGDMVCQEDISLLWKMKDSSKAVQVIKHEYKTKANKKYLNNINIDYPKKNWSSVIIWNCAHPKNKVLNPEFISCSDGKFLHRFMWLDDEDIGELTLEWNWLAIEYPPNPNAKLIHFTLGTPCFSDYSQSEMSDEWHSAFELTMSGYRKT
jgi:lipopolysaccharide biosynthesis glycosyltransferase